MAFFFPFQGDYLADFNRAIHADGAINEGRGRHITARQTKQSNKKTPKQFFYPALYSDAPPSSGLGMLHLQIAQVFSIGIFCGNSSLNP